MLTFGRSIPIKYAILKRIREKIDEAMTMMARKRLWCIDALPLTPLSRVTPIMRRALHILNSLKKLVLLPNFVRASLNRDTQSILKREATRPAESQESGITVVAKVIKSRHFGVSSKMFTSRSSSLPVGHQKAILLPLKPLTPVF